MTGVYVHIPFCRSRCAYCNFVSSTLAPEWQERYLCALEREIAARRGENGEPLASTVYIGGGTPSQLSPQVLGRLVRLLRDNFRFSPGAEFTLEVNPDDVTPALIRSLKDTPVNRISMGAQSLDDDVLRFLRRRHTARQVPDAIKRLQDAGYTNLSVDLIYGIPQQTLSMFESDVAQVLATGIPHLSAYALQIESGTPLGDMLAQGTVEEADEELSLSCYTSLLSLTEEAGMEHYELSNFALPGFQSRHNSSYWTGAPYLGFGAGAHSYDGHNLRTANTPSVLDYISGRWTAEREVLTEGELYDERVMLSLRTLHGLALSHVKEQFGERMLAYLLRQASPHIASGSLVRDGDTLRLSRGSLFVSNFVISDLLVAD